MPIFVEGGEGGKGRVYTSRLDGFLLITYVWLCGKEGVGMGGGGVLFDFVVCGCVVVCGERESGGGDDCVFEVDVCVKKKR